MCNVTLFTFLKVFLYIAFTLPLSDNLMNLQYLQYLNELVSCYPNSFNIRICLIFRKRILFIFLTKLLFLPILMLTFSVDKYIFFVVNAYTVVNKLESLKAGGHSEWSDFNPTFHYSAP